MQQLISTNRCCAKSERLYNHKYCYDVDLNFVDIDPVSIVYKFDQSLTNRLAKVARLMNCEWSKRLWMDDERHTMAY